MIWLRLRWPLILFRLAATILKSRRNLLLENLALRHQLLVLGRTARRPRLNRLDRALWAWRFHTWSRWRIGLRIVQPDTVIQRHRGGFRLFWKWESRPAKLGRKSLTPDTITLIDSEPEPGQSVVGRTSPPRRVAQAGLLDRFLRLDYFPAGISKTMRSGCLNFATMAAVPSGRATREQPEWSQPFQAPPLTGLNTASVPTTQSLVAPATLRMWAW